MINLQSWCAACYREHAPEQAPSYKTEKNPHRYSSRLFSNTLSCIINKVSSAFGRFAASLSELAAYLSELIAKIHMSLTTSQQLPSTEVDDKTFISNGSNTIEEAIKKAINVGKEQLRQDAPRHGKPGSSTHYLVNGTLANNTNVEHLIKNMEQSTSAQTKHLRMFSMFNQGFYATLSSLLMSHLNDRGLTKEQVELQVQLALGADIQLEVNGTSYFYTTKSDVITMLDTEKQTITGHQLFTPSNEMPDNSYKSATNLLEFPKHPYYIRTTYHYGHPHTIKIEKLDPKYFPQI